MKKTIIKTLLFFVVIACAVLLGRQILLRFQEQGASANRNRGRQAAPVQVAEIERGSITLHRTFSGSLEARTEFVVAPKIGGRIEQLTVDLADTVERGRTVAKLDDDEYIQAKAQAEADLAVAKANLVQANSALKIAGKEYERIKTLRQRGVASDAQLDEAEARLASTRAGAAVAKAQVTRAEALLETTNIRLGYTVVTVDWADGDGARVVAERLADEGDTVSANTPLFRIVALDPIIGVIFITEKDYARMAPGRAVRLTTDAFPDDLFEGRVSRISPVFQQATRQVRVEMTVANPEHRLKPGMFIRATVEFESVANAVIVPEGALTRRAEQTGVFVVDEAARTVGWRVVTVGIREGDRVQIIGGDLSGRVVTLGHQLVDDGSAVTIPDDKRADEPADESPEQPADRGGQAG